MDDFQEDTVLVDAAVKCEGCGMLVATLLPASDGRSVCATCCQESESASETTTWDGINPLDPAFGEDTLPMDRAADLQARIQGSQQS